MELAIPGPFCDFQMQALAVASCRERFMENQARGLGLGGGTGSALFQSKELGVQVRAAAVEREEWEPGPDFISSKADPVSFGVQAVSLGSNPRQ